MKTVIETERLFLRELALSDTNDLAKVLCNETSMLYYPKAFTLEEVKRWINTNIKRYGVFGYGLWGVVLKSTRLLIGDCGLTIQSIDGESLPEIGFHINPSYCQHGYATEAGKAVLEYGHNEFKLRRIYSYCISENIPSQKTMKKIGMDYHKTYFSNTGKETTVYIKTFD